MNRRTFLLSAAASAALLFTGCKGNESNPPAQGDGSTAPAATHQCACPPGECACPECKEGHGEACPCGAPKAGDGAGSGQ
ncbi:MAG: hypothetical protein M9894_22365 [Planctomycetes bacterium]|nr:hypothetical protein [Planctomycetota bacterium]